MVSSNEFPAALVTGATGGIGRAVCQRLARDGISVVAAGRDEERLAETVAMLEDQGGVALPLALDLEDRGAIPAAAARARELAEPFGPLAWLVNNAGMAVSAPLVEKDRGEGPDLYDRHLAVNFHGARLLFEALLPALRDHGDSAVVNVASSAGLVGYAYVAAYCASKHALVGYTRAAALELDGKGVRVNAVCPHYVDSPLTDASVRRIVETTGRGQEEARAFFEGQNPGGRLVTTEEVADAVCGLLQGDANGRIVELDGDGEPKELR